MLVGYIEVTEVGGRKVISEVWETAAGFVTRGITFPALPDCAFMYRGMQGVFEHPHMQATWDIFSK